MEKNDLIEIIDYLIEMHRFESYQDVYNSFFNGESSNIGNACEELLNIAISFNNSKAIIYLRYSADKIPTDSELKKILGEKIKEEKSPNSNRMIDEFHAENGEVIIGRTGGNLEGQTLVKKTEMGSPTNPIVGFPKQETEKENGTNFKTIQEISLLKETGQIKLNEEQMEIYNAVMAEPDSNLYSILVDDRGNLCNKVIKSGESDDINTIYTVSIQSGKVVFEPNKSVDNSKGNDKQKKLTMPDKHGNGFINILILAFVIGSFFGVIFLAIYSKIMA